MIGFLQKIDDVIEPLRKVADNFAWPVLDITIRVTMAQIFLASGWKKFENFLNGNWELTVGQFTNAHTVPGIDPNLLAVAGTAGEVLLPGLLIAGLFTRFSAAGLIVMTLVIEFLAVSDFGFGEPERLSNPDHYFWMLLLAVPFIKGASILSVDHWLVKFIRK